MPDGYAPALYWFAGLGTAAKVKVLATATNVDKYMDRGQPISPVLDFVRNSPVRLMQFRATREGSAPPHLWMFGTLLGGTFWAASGFTRRRYVLIQREVESAEQLCRNWTEEGEADG